MMLNIRDGPIAELVKPSLLTREQGTLVMRR